MNHEFLYDGHETLERIPKKDKKRKEVNLRSQGHTRFDL